MTGRRRRSWWDGITPTGLIVTLTAAVCALILTGTSAYLWITKQYDAAKDCAIGAAAAVTGLIGMAARTRPDPAATVDPPAAVPAEPIDGA